MGIGNTTTPPFLSALLNLPAEETTGRDYFGFGRRGLTKKKLLLDFAIKLHKPTGGPFDVCPRWAALTLRHDGQCT
jgi:hypothetical protein